MRNILVVSEFFAEGGLETHLLGQVEVLSEMGFRLHLATSSSASTVAQGAFASCTFDVPMGRNRSAREIFSAVEQLRAIVNAERIDVVHAHPFLSMIIAGCVAKVERLPLVLTLHGPASIAYFQPDTIAGLMMSSSILPNASAVIAVSEETRLLCRTVTARDVLVLPNSVTRGPEKAPPAGLNLPWMWAGRMDNDKVVGLRHLIEFVASSGRIQLDIFGAGPARSTVEQQIAELGASQQMIALKEWHDDLPSLMIEYGVIAGMGRVILEGALANRACLLVGYDGVKGFLTEERARRASFWNLSGRGLRNLGISELVGEVEAVRANQDKYLIYDWVQRDRNARHIWLDYTQILANLDPFCDKRIEIFLEILNYAGDEPQDFWSSHRCFQILRGSFSALDLG